MCRTARRLTFQITQRMSFFTNESVTQDDSRYLFRYRKMSARWTQENAVEFWNQRKWQMLMLYSGVARRNNQWLQQLVDRQEREQRQREAFELEHHHRAIPGHSPVLATQEATDLRFWCQNSSWTYCQNCGSLLPVKLLPSFSNRKPTTEKNSCTCLAERYVIPSDEELPVRILDLTEDDIRLLRPFDVHCGDYTRRQHG